MLACASLAVNKEALACSFSRAPALPLNTHDALIRQEASPSQRLATCLVLIFVLLGCGSQTTIQCKPCRCHKLCSHAPKAHTENVRALFCTQNKRAIIDQASLHSGFIAPCIICTQRENQCIAFPAHKQMCAAKKQVMRFSSMHKKRLHKTCSALVPQHEKKKWRKKNKKRTEIPLFLPFFHPFSAVFGLVFANN